MNKIDSKVTEGPLCPRLVKADTAMAAVTELQSKSQRWTFVIWRPPIDWASGEAQSPRINVTESDLVNLPRIESMLMKSRRVQIVAESDDRGLVMIDVTGRRWSVLVDSPKIRSLLSEFDQCLIEGARTRFASLTAAALVTVWPFLLLVFLVIAQMSVDPGFRKAVNTSNYNYPAWTDKISPFLPVVWIPSAIAGVIIVVACLMSGGLRTWPKYLSFANFVRTLYQFRINYLARDSLRIVFTSVISSVIAAALALLFFGKR